MFLVLGKYLQENENKDFEMERRNWLTIVRALKNCINPTGFFSRDKLKR